jgi:Sedlin, N-terminal conserved region
MTKLEVLGVAVIGKNNEPLYLCDCAAAAAAMAPSPSSEQQQQQQHTDPFGFASMASEQQRMSLPLRHQIVLHAALDGLNDLVHYGGRGGQMPVIKNPTPNVPHWVGKLYEDSNSDNDDDGGTVVYGYVTATNIKFLVLTGGTSGAAGSAKAKLPNNPDLKRLQALLRELHQAYIGTIANPFSQTRGPIVSTRFDETVRRAVAKLTASATATQAGVVVD